MNIKLKKILFTILIIIGISLIILFVPFNQDFTEKDKNTTKEIKNFLDVLNKYYYTCYDSYSDFHFRYYFKDINNNQKEQLLNIAINACSQSPKSIENIPISKVIPKDKEKICKELKSTLIELYYFALKDLLKIKKNFNNNKINEIEASKLIVAVKSSDMMLKEHILVKNRSIIQMLKHKYSDKKILIITTELIKCYQISIKLNKEGN